MTGIIKKSFIAVVFLLAFFTAISCIRTKDSVAVIDTAELVTEPVVEEPEQVLPVLEMFPYEGRVLNIFFHPLVARPEVAFNSRLRTHFMEWYVTAGEYQKILYELYLNDYVLVDIKELYDVSYTDGRKNVHGKKPMVPEGKKPLIISIDDLSYHTNVRQYASVHKLVIDDDGQIAAWTDGELSYDLDVVTYMEEFVKKYPDFSLRGARGIIALTGYEGVLGYQTHLLDSPDYEEEKEKAMAVAEKIKELGWHFASHSWGHPDLSVVSMERFLRDTNRWDSEVRPILGDTDLFIYPFGEGVEEQAEKHAVLRNRGFNVFFDVGSGFGYHEGRNYIYFDRRSIDGVFFRTYRNQPFLFDISKVVDSQARRPL
ncbi:MAG: polysaccharide deacetylase family protein [Treponema sp.]|nr:polysaccharide deacetylase family protein [Treponema sp.]